MIPFDELKARLLKNPAVKVEYDALEEEFAVAAALIAARAEANLSQDEVAELMHTKQGNIARLESGRSNPSLKTLKNYAAATGTRLRISFEPVQAHPAP